jgi:hypothetical protein
MIVHEVKIGRKPTRSQKGNIEKYMSDVLNLIFDIEICWSISGNVGNFTLNLR